ncbi:MAG: hypothetical protein ACRELF_23490, partial [Gemmataceae bacterium]
LAMVSPWRDLGTTATSVGVSAVIWVIVVQWISSGIGGFLAGRLRIKWPGVHNHEVFFRDTAHGFLAWSLATVAGILLLASVATSGVGGIVKATSDVGGAAAGAAQAGRRPVSARSKGSAGAYFVDAMFRSTTGGTGDVAAARGEAARILAHSVKKGRIALSQADKSYLTGLVAARAGISETDAGKRIADAVSGMNHAAQQVRAVADHARKRAAQLAIVIALSMLVGAFVASVAAALGGGIRDEF